MAPAPPKAKKQSLIWQSQLQKPPESGVARASLEMKEHCDDPSGFCDLLVSEACHCPHLDVYIPNGLLDLDDFCCRPTATTTSASSSATTSNTSAAPSNNNKNNNNKSGQPPPPKQFKKKHHNYLFMTNPVHALHMASQLEADSSLTETNHAVVAVNSPLHYHPVATTTTTTTTTSNSNSPAPATTTTTTTSSPWMYGEEQQRTFALSQAGVQETFFPILQPHIFHVFNPPNPEAPPSVHGPDNNTDVVVVPVATTSSITTTTTTTTTTPVLESVTSSKKGDNDNDKTLLVVVDETTTPATASPTKPSESATTAPSVSFASPMTTVQTIDPREDTKEDSAGSSTTTTTSDDNTNASTTPMEGVVVEETKVDAASSTKDDPTETRKDDDTKQDVVMAEEAASADVTEDDDTKPAEAAADPGTNDKGNDEPKESEKAAVDSNQEEKAATTTTDKKEVNQDETSTEKERSSPPVNKDQDGSTVREAKQTLEERPETSKDTATTTDKDATEDDDKGDVKNDAKKKSDGDKDATEDDAKKSDGDKAQDVDTMKDGASSAASNDKEETVASSTSEPETAPEAKEGMDDAETKEDSSEKSNDAESKVEEKTPDKKEDLTTKEEEAKKTPETEDAVVKEEPQEDGDKAKQVTSDVDEKKMAEAADGAEKDATKEGGSETKDDAKPESAESKPGEKANDDPMDVSTDKHKAISETKLEGSSETKPGSTSDKNDPPEKENDDDGKKNAATDDKDDMEVDPVKKEGSEDTPAIPPDSTEESKKQEEKDDKPDGVVSQPTTVDGEKKDGIPSTVTPATAASSAIASADQEMGPPTAGASAAKDLTPTYVPVPPPAPAPVPYHLSTGRYLEINKKEEQMKIIRGMLSKRKGKKNKKKRKLEVTTTGGATHSALQNLPGSLQYSNERALTVMDSARMAEWHHQKATANRRVELWLESFRTSRRSYWKEANMEHHPANQKGTTSFSEWSNIDIFRRTCPDCSEKKNPQHFYGDEIMQCLECPFVGCGPVSVCPRSKHQHMLQHLFLSGHKFAVTCGMRAEVFCFPCGDFVYHSLFDQERERVDMETKFPWLAWSDHPLNRSFDPLQFAQVEEYGIVWRGAKATYPPLVPQEHVDATRFCLQRQALFEGYVLEKQWPLMGRRALDFSIVQNQRTGMESWRIPAPVGMYNLGNTCFMSSILQCLVHCIPLQKYFLKDIGHNHKSCDLYRRLKPSDEPMLDAMMAAHKRNSSVCLACEMDSLFLQYYGRATGRDVVSILADLSASPRRSVMDLFDEISGRDEESTSKGEPLITAKMLHVAWKSGGMGHLAGYEQRDAHEFLHAFLDILGKQICQHRARVDGAIAMSRCGNPFVKQQEQVHHDVIKHLFQGTLRSVLVCEECGTKRTLSEPFLNISLHISKDNTTMDKLSVDNCLEHFTKPEKLADPVDCPTCGKKTSTKKQHTFSKLPKVLCVHLKRFHAALHKKIEDFVSFPARGLNMGPHLPHWREVTTVPEKTEIGNSSNPEVLYDLFGTVNHQGNLQSGHYVTNIKVNDAWYRCNDQHVSSSSEAAVLTSDGAYILFYARR